MLTEGRLHSPKKRLLKKALNGLTVAKFTKIWNTLNITKTPRIETDGGQSQESLRYLIAKIHNQAKTV